MPRFAANVSMLFTEWPFLDRFEQAARAGFRAVEFQFPYAFDPHEIRDRLDAFGLQAVLHNLPAGDWAAGERGIACLPGRDAEFAQGLEQALVFARLLGVRQLNCLAGVAPVDADPALLHQMLLSRLQRAALVLGKAGIRLLVEPLNTFDVPGFCLNRSAQALALLDELKALGVDNVALQYDLYHAQRMEGDLAATLQRHLSRIGHVQIADNPGRHEPGSGEINYRFLFQHLDRIGYGGWVGCEYLPAAGTLAGLVWREQLIA